MRINNLLEYTEHHRFYIFRDFSLSSLDYRMISLIYQPMVGAFAVAFYQQLYHGIAEGCTGYSALEPQRKLFLGLGLDMNERARRHLIEQASKLEAVGLLQTSRLGLPENADVIYEYELAQPLSPAEFFRNMHLTMLLRDKIGKYAVISLRESFGANEPDELADAQLTKENISMPFYELFKLNMQSVDNEFEQALTEVASSRQTAARPALATAGIPYGEIIMRFPRNSANRRFVERLRGDDDQLAQVNYVAYKYSLTVVDICRLLDEDGIFDQSGELNVDELQLRANQFYRQDKKREGDRQRTLARTQVMADEESADADELTEEYEVQEQDYLPVPNQLHGRCDVQQYNMLMRNEPHTRFLQRFFPGAIPDWIERVFERIDINYKLAAPVINVLIHYVLGANEAQRVTKTFLDAVASNMLVKQIDTFEKAVLYVREQAQVEQDKERRKEAAASFSGGKGGSRGGGSSRGTSRKPSIQIVQEGQPASAVSADELEELRKLARKLDGK
ncbi:replication initiation and membrane attachment protein [Paenibacillus castaneae]|uniref:helicase DnaB n=1 Tax=Paenibacillus castaneae TaxID=474957 RepID=UPI000C9C9938|nr:helicase DnaB [Paenibacillus castaneae]NIK78497.1 replication initiation and membrane attachment protein [Paenibacillus castaneae]